MLTSNCYGATATAERWIGYAERDAQSLTYGDAMVSWV